MWELLNLWQMLIKIMKTMFVCTATKLKKSKNFNFCKILNNTTFLIFYSVSAH